MSDLGQIDGVDMWSTLVAGTQSPRTEFVHNIDDMGDKYAAIRWTDWKYIKGNLLDLLCDSKIKQLYHAILFWLSVCLTDVRITGLNPGIHERLGQFCLDEELGRLPIGHRGSIN